MNLSGVAVGAYANFYHIDPDDIAVIQDDMDMPVGQLRIRRKGSAGGHNGIKSITEHLGTDAYPRFKIGIGHPARNNKAVVNHVLHAFQGEDKTAIEAAVAEMATALEEWIKSGDIEEVMQAHNKKRLRLKTCSRINNIKELARAVIAPASSFLVMQYIQQNYGLLKAGVSIGSTAPVSGVRSAVPLSTILSARTKPFS